MMTEERLTDVGQRIAQLRYQRQLKQAELARAAGISLRTLQRLEGGEVVKSDALLSVLDRLGRLEGVLAALAPDALSPYEQLAQAGLSSADLGTRRATNTLDRITAENRDGPRRRVRRAPNKRPSRKASTFQWPEDAA